MIALEKTEAGREAIVLLQGDHGARVMDVFPLDTAPELRARDLAMAHSAMFVVRLADQEAQTRMGRYPLYMLMQGWRDGGFNSLETPPQPAILRDGCTMDPRKGARIAAIPLGVKQELASSFHN